MTFWLGWTTTSSSPDNRTDRLGAQRRAWPAHRGKAGGRRPGVADLRLINGTLRITRRRALTRCWRVSAAAVVCERGGAGQVKHRWGSRNWWHRCPRDGADADLIQTSEAGVGGIPASGCSAAQPGGREFWRGCFNGEERLDVSCSGLRWIPASPTYRGGGPWCSWVGGPAISPTRERWSAGSFVHGARVRVRDGSVRCRGGRRKFVDAVREGVDQRAGAGQGRTFGTHNASRTLPTHREGGWAGAGDARVDIGWDLVARPRPDRPAPVAGGAAGAGTIVTGEGSRSPSAPAPRPGGGCSREEPR